MGFFSWKTQDTNKSIANAYSDRDTFKVVMHDDKGNQWIETRYEGYGEFGGKDFYTLMAEMNGYEGRDDGISLAFGKLKTKNEDGILKFPNLTETENWDWIDEEPENCRFQGFFYNDGSEDDDEEDEY